MFQMKNKIIKVIIFFSALLNFTFSIGQNLNVQQTLDYINSKLNDGDNKSVYGIGIELRKWKFDLSSMDLFDSYNYIWSMTPIDYSYDLKIENGTLICITSIYFEYSAYIDNSDYQKGIEQIRHKYLAAQEELSIP